MLRALLLFVLGFMLGVAEAAPVYKCADGKGPVAYQGTPCAPDQTSRLMTLRTAPVTAPVIETDARVTTKPRRSTKAAGTAGTAKQRLPRRGAGRSATVPDAGRGAQRDQLSWQCRVGNGEVYYQHAPCPPTVIASVELRDGRTRGRHRSAAQAVPVSATPLPRAEACRRIHAASASSRAGHERDEDVSSYERSLGRDPCR